MENEQDTKKKDKPIPEEELFDELDAMYQRVADIEKEEAIETLPPIEPKSSSVSGTRVASEKGLKKKSGRNKKRSYRPMILGVIAVLFALILGGTLWKPMAILQFLKIGDVQQPTAPSRPAPRKPSAVVTPKTLPVPPPAATSPATPQPPAAVTSPAPPIPPAVATPPTPPKPPAAVIPPAPPIPPAVATAPTPPNPKSPSESVPVQTKQEAVKSPAAFPQGKFYAIQIGSFREMENVRDLVEALKKEGLDAYWIASKSQKRGALYKVFVGRFTDTNKAAQFQREKKILKNYSDSFIQEISSSAMIEGSSP
jgi:cell division septation protein DedD